MPRRLISHSPGYSGVFAASLDSKTLDHFRQIKIGEILDHPPGDNFWQDLIKKLPEAAIEELACGNSLIAVKR